MFQTLAQAAFFIFAFALTSWADTVRFPASDGLEITAEASGDGNGPVVVLFHMAGSSRGEYTDIAPRLHALGYRTLAVDQRSGRSSNGVKNETAAQLPSDPGYGAAVPDLVAAVNYARGEMGASKIGVLGSSYSASLVLVLAGQAEGSADAVMSFSPGEYFSDRSFVRKAAAQIDVPTFLTAARSEIRQVQPLADAIPSGAVVFTPSGGGRHGAGTLVSGDGAEYWTALEGFLGSALPAR